MFTCNMCSIDCNCVSNNSYKNNIDMKANEAPEKIYVSNYSSGLTYNWHNERLAVNDIEYTRTDAFIEKALAYLNSKFYFNNAFYGVVSTDFNAMKELFEDFEKYIKGE